MPPRMTRHAIAALAALSLLSWATSAPAGLVAFSGDPAPPGSLVFAANGQLSGTVPISVVAPTSGLLGPPDPRDPTYAVTNGTLFFALGRSLGPVNPRPGLTGPTYEYAFGGTVTIAGSFNGGPMETLVSGTGELGGGYLDGAAQGGAGTRWRFDLGQIGFVAILADDLRAAYRANKGVVADLVVDFIGTPGGPSGGVDAGASVTVRFATGPSAVPEPASAGLLGVGGGIGWVWGFVRKKRVVF